MNQALQPDKIKRLLVRGTNWVGDSVMVLPALKQVRQEFSQAHITLLVLPWVSGIYEEADCIDQILIYDRERDHRGIRGRARLIQTLRRSHFEAALLFQNAFEAALLAKLARIPIRAGYRRDGRGWLLTHPVSIDLRISPLHQTYYYLDLVDQLLDRPRVALGASRTPIQDAAKVPPLPDISLQVSFPRKQAARNRLRAEGIDPHRKLIGVNPGAAFGSAKRWLSDRYAELLDRLIEQQGANVVVFGAPRELGIAESIRSLMRHPATLLTGKTELCELIALIACCDLFITNDSGPMHLAAALQVPTVAIFGPTNEIATGPLSPIAVVLNKKVECSPCLLRECPIDHRCMTRITVDEVYQHASRLLSA